jgi:hypothetical protein
MDALHERGVDYALLEADPSNADRFAAVLQILHDVARLSGREGDPRPGRGD